MTQLEQQFWAHLTIPDCHPVLLDTVDSTNTVAKRMAEEGAPDGTVVIARHQTAGRGRLGRSFFSPADSGLYMSVLLRPSLSPEDVSLLTPCAAVAVSEAIEGLSGKKTAIKWVNDIFIDGKKVSGILTESAFTPDGTALSWVIVGIGVNITPPAQKFPAELTSIASSVLEHTDTDLRGTLAASILNRFMAYCPHLQDRFFYETYREKLLQLHRPVQILRGNETTSGFCIDLDRDFRLLVHTMDGTITAVSSGEVSVRPEVEA